MIQTHLRMKEQNNSPIPTDHDTPWKTIIKELFEDFIAFFLPAAYELIDFNKPAQFLEQELHKIVADKIKKGKVINDKLVKVYLKDGSEKWILIHIEIQSSFETNFSKRMFTYFYRIFDKYDQEVTALAIYTGKKVPRAYNTFQYDFLGTESYYKFNTYQIRKAQEADLLKSNNIFALVVLATQYLNQDKSDAQKRYAFKRKLIQLALDKNHTKTQIISLLKFVQLVLRLPENLELKFAAATIRTFSKPNNMSSKSLTILADQFYLAAYGETWEEKLAALEQEAEKEAQAKVEKEVLIKQTKIVRKLLKETDFSEKHIAELLELPIETVLAIKAQPEEK